MLLLLPLLLLHACQLCIRCAVTTAVFAAQWLHKEPHCTPAPLHSVNVDQQGCPGVPLTSTPCAT
jgi:hypothetical protein